MEEELILSALGKRCHGDFYLGVVGSIRSGKSTFINQFIKLKVLPYVTDDFLKNKILDELPQTAPGKQIMTMEPKFIPSQQIEIKVNDCNLNLRCVDSVGYVIKDAIGYKNEDGPRMVKTPWDEEEIEFEEAAHLGTTKIMENHSNLAIVMTSDGSWSDFKREDYKKVEDEIIPKMISLKKPFIVVLNTLDKNKSEALAIKEEIEQTYNVFCYVTNVQTIDQKEMDEILSNVLNEFDINELNIVLPSYLEKIGDDISLKKSIKDLIDAITLEYKKFKDIQKMVDKLYETNYFSNVSINLKDSSEGIVELKLDLKKEYYLEILNEILGFEIKTDEDFITKLYESRIAMNLYNKYSNALEECKEKGYGVALPELDEMKLLPPSLIKQGSKYGVKLCAIAPSIHFLKIDVESSFSPMIGNEEQSKLLVDSFDEANPESLWDKEIFGRKLSEIVNDGIRQKIYQLPQSSKDKVSDVLKKLTNQEHNSLIAIIL